MDTDKGGFVRGDNRLSATWGPEAWAPPPVIPANVLQTVKLSPQPQVCFVLGLLNRNPSFKPLRP
jgi:hypothetical protein